MLFLFIVLMQYSKSAKAEKEVEKDSIYDFLYARKVKKKER